MNNNISYTLVMSSEEDVSQRAWDDVVCTAIFSKLISRPDTVNRARLLTVSSTGFGDWLHALPCANLGLRLGNDELRLQLVCGLASH
jgi:hypothetical protein